MCYVSTGDVDLLFDDGVTYTAPLSHVRKRLSVQVRDVQSRSNYTVNGINRIIRYILCMNTSLCTLSTWGCRNILLTSSNRANTGGTELKYRHSSSAVTQVTLEKYFLVSLKFRAMDLSFISVAVITTYNTSQSLDCLDSVW